MDPSVNRVVARIAADGGSLVVARDAIWTTQAGALLRTDPEPDRLLARVRLDSVRLTDLAVGQGASGLRRTARCSGSIPDRVDR